MARPIKARKSQQSLVSQAAAAGAQIHQRYGAAANWPALHEILLDRTHTPYPCEVRFDANPLLPGEFAHSLANGLNPEAGFTIYIHPVFQSQPERLPYLVFYQLALVHLGQDASPEAAETFGAHALGLTNDDYYHALCDLSDQLGGDELC